jgi:F-type H+-transporting ATPase subunit b
MGFGINLPVIISQLVNFFILFGLLYLVAYKPILKMLDERSKKIKENMKLTEEIKSQSSLAQQQVKQQIENAGKQAQDIIARATVTGEEIRRKAQQDARQEADALISKAKAGIQAEHDRSFVQMRDEIADLVVLATGKVIGKVFDKETHLQLIERVLEESIPLKKE